MSKYKMSNLGPIKQFLRPEIERLEDGAITLSQTSYITCILQRFGMEDSNLVPTPLYYKIRLDTAEATDTEADIVEYQSLIGSLMYVARGTRPDIAYAVAALSRYYSKPYASHMSSAKRVLRYLKATADMKLIFPSTSNEETICAYTDSYFAADSADRKSQGGYIFTVYSGPVSC